MPPKPTKSKPAHLLAKQLAALSIAVTAGVLSAAPTLLRLRPELVSEAVDLVEDEFPDDEKARVYALLAHDPRVKVRVRVADAVASLYPSLASEALSVLSLLAGDSASVVRSAAARGLGRLLERASFIHRLEMACQWAVSERVAERVLVAEALRSPTVVPVADWIIEQLARDGDTAVRVSAAHAALRRSRQHPHAYARMLAELAADPSPEVRQVLHADSA